MPDGREVYRFTLANDHGTTVQIINYGGIVTSVVTPDRDGIHENVVLGFDSLDQYLKEHPYFGAVVGRCVNRMDGATFTLDGTTYSLTANEGQNHLHGGLEGFDKKMWNAEIIQDRLKLQYLSRDGEEGYPSNLDVTIYYGLTDDSELTIRYHTATDRATPVNLSNHSYFNLSGNVANTIHDHMQQLNADRYTPKRDDLVLTGGIRPVEGTPVDFR